MRVVLAFIVGGLLGLSWEVSALRITQPQTIFEWNTNTFSQLNQTLQDMWNLSNGRYTLDVTLTDPDGSRAGDKGDMILYDNSGTGTLCVAMNDGTDWDCATLAE